MVQNITPSPVIVEANPYIIDLHRLGKWVFLILLMIILLALLLKIILDLRRFHYKE